MTYKFSNIPWEIWSAHLEATSDRWSHVLLVSDSIYVHSATASCLQLKLMFEFAEHVLRAISKRTAWMENKMLFAELCLEVI